MQMQRFSASLPMMLYRALDVVMPRFRQIFRDYNITEQQWRVLRVLWEHEELQPRVLAELTLIPGPSLVGVVDRLESRGLVARRRDEQDRRSSLVAATDEGRNLEHQVMPRVEAAYRELKQSVDRETWHQLLAGLESICTTGSEVRSTAVNE